MFRQYILGIIPPEYASYKEYAADEWKDMMATYVAMTIYIIRKIQNALH